MRILLASRNFFPDGVVGGAQVSMRYLAKALVKQGHDVAVLSLDSQEHTGIHTATGLAEFRLKIKNKYTSADASAMKKARWHATDRFYSLMNKDFEKVLATFKPDVVNTNVLAGLGVGLWNVAAKAGVPVVHTVHDYYLMCIKSGMFANGKNCEKPCLSCHIAALSTSMRAARNVQEVIYVSEHMKVAHHKLGLFAQNTGSTIIHGAYLPDQPITKRVQNITDHNVLTLGYFGRLSPEKGVDKLLHILRDLPKDKWRLRIGGGGTPAYVDKLKELSEGLPITFLGIVSPDAFYSSIDAVIISSLWNDPAPRVAYESGIHEVVPLVANRGGLPELVDYGKRGLIFEPDLPETLQGHIRDIIDHPEHLANFRSAWDQDKSIFHPDTVAQNTLDVFYRAIAASKKARADL